VVVGLFVSVYNVCLTRSPTLVLSGVGGPCLHSSFPVGSSPPFSLSLGCSQDRGLCVGPAFPPEETLISHDLSCSPLCLCLSFCLYHWCLAISSSHLYHSLYPLGVRVCLFFLPPSVSRSPPNLCSCHVLGFVYFSLLLPLIACFLLSYILTFRFTLVQRRLWGPDHLVNLTQIYHVHYLLHPLF
jgi:hypothetical protein